jgi:hypothetical protein
MSLSRCLIPPPHRRAVCSNAALEGLQPQPLLGGSRSWDPQPVSRCSRCCGTRRTSTATPPSSSSTSRSTLNHHHHAFRFEMQARKGLHRPVRSRKKHTIKLCLTRVLLSSCRAGFAVQIRLPLTPPSSSSTSRSWSPSDQTIKLTINLAIKLTIKLTFWVGSANPSTFERNRARAVHCVQAK